MNTNPTNDPSTWPRWTDGVADAARREITASVKPPCTHLPVDDLHAEAEGRD